MGLFVNITVYFLFSAVIFKTMKYIKLPNASLMGGMIGSSILNLNGYEAFAWLPITFFVSNVLIGIAIGRQINKKLLSDLCSILKVVLYFVIGMLLLSVLAGYLVFTVSNIPIVTAMISTATGGTAEMISLALSLSLHNDVPIIVFFQMVRVIVFLTLIPYLSSISGTQNLIDSDATSLKKGISLPFNIRDYIILFFVSILLALLCRFSGFYLGNILAPLFFTGFYVTFTGKIFNISQIIRDYIQIFIGINIGQLVSNEVIFLLPSLIIPAILMVIVMFITMMIFANILAKIKKWDRTTCLLCVSPVGLSQIVMFAEDLGVDIVIASIFHTFRVVSILLIYPIIVSLFLN